MDSPIIGSEDNSHCEENLSEDIEEPSEDNYLTPLDCAIQAFGSLRAVARALEIQPTIVSQWRKPEERRGCGGFIPRKQAMRLLYIAREQGYDLSGDDLLMGRYHEAG